MKNKKIAKIILYLLFYCIPFVDSFSGLLVKFNFAAIGGLGAVTQIVKGCILLLCLYFYINNTNFINAHLLFMFISISLFFILFISLIFGTLFTSIKIDFLIFYKIFYLILIFLFFNKIIKAKFISCDKLINLFITNGIICSLLIIITTLLKINFSTYDNTFFGTRGLFLSGNGIGVYLGAISFLALIVSQKFPTLINRCKGLFLVCINMIIGTKASLIFLIVGLLYFTLCIARIGKLIIPIAIFICFQKAVFTTVFEVVLFRIKNTTSILEQIFGGRMPYLEYAFSVFDTDGPLSLRIVTGLGPYLNFRLPNIPMMFDKMTPSLDGALETDFFDIFFYYGAIALSAYLLIFFTCIFKTLKRRNFQITLLCICVFFYSLVAGHILFNGTSGTLIPLVLIITKYFKQNKNRRINQNESTYSK